MCQQGFWDTLVSVYVYVYVYGMCEQVPTSKDLKNGSDILDLELELK